MRLWVILVVLVGFFGVAGVVNAYDLRLRAVFPNPIGNDEGEWLAIENVSQASVAAQLYSVRDVYGSVKTYSLGSFFPLELKTILASQSGITLNNTGEMVELLYLGQIIESSPKFVATQEGKVTVQLDSDWWELSVEEYHERSTEKDWREMENIPAEELESFTENPGVVQLAEDEQMGVELTLEPSITEQPITTPRRFPQLFKSDSLPATIPGIPQWPVPPEPDYDREMEVFLEWKREALVGSLALVFGGVCLLAVVLPPVPEIWRWLRDELLL